MCDSENIFQQKTNTESCFRGSSEYLQHCCLWQQWKKPLLVHGVLCPSNPLHSQTRINSGKSWALCSQIKQEWVIKLILTCQGRNHCSVHSTVYSAGLETPGEESTFLSPIVNKGYLPHICLQIAPCHVMICILLVVCMFSSVCIILFACALWCFKYFLFRPVSIVIVIYFLLAV